VDVYCNDWSHEDPDDFRAQKQLPQAFLHRRIRRYSEKKVEANSAAEKTNRENTTTDSKTWRCYMKHESTEDEEECKSSPYNSKTNMMHMRYNKECDYGFFE
jgi:hypothetical protein